MKISKIFLLLSFMTSLVLFISIIKKNKNNNGHTQKVSLNQSLIIEKKNLNKNHQKKPSQNIKRNTASIIPNKKSIPKTALEKKLTQLLKKKFIKVRNLEVKFQKNVTIKGKTYSQVIVKTKVKIFDHSEFNALIDKDGNIIQTWNNSSNNRGTFSQNSKGFSPSGSL